MSSKGPGWGPSRPGRLLSLGVPAAPAVPTSPRAVLPKTTYHVLRDSFFIKHQLFSMSHPRRRASDLPWPSTEPGERRGRAEVYMCTEKVVPPRRVSSRLWKSQSSQE